jgi:ankyrin repeat protein
MTYSLVAVKPNIDYILDQHQCHVKHNNSTASISYNRETASAEVNIDGIISTVTKDATFKVGDARFTVKIEDGQCVFFPQSDGLQAQGDFNNSFVHKCIQNNLRNVMAVINKVSELEQNEKRINASTIAGYNAADAAQGYALACQLYLTAHLKGLSKTEKDELTNAYQTLVFLSQSALETEAIWSEYLQFLLNNPNWYDGLAKSPATAKLVEISHTLAGKLLQEKSVLINYGLKGELENGTTKSGHHEVIKITFSGNSETGIGKYNYIIYNAGYETELVNAERGIVTGIREYELNCQNRNEIERFILLAHERLMRSDKGVTKDKFDKINQEMEKYVVKRIRADQKPAQRRGNCTTMSTRLALEDMMTPELFRKFHNFVSNTQQIVKLIATPIAADPPSPTATVKKDKVKPNIAKLAQQLANNSKLFQTSGISVTIQEAINRGNSASILPLLKDEKNKAKSNYLAGAAQASPLAQQYNISSGKTATLLHYAIINGNKDLAAYCLESGMTGLEKDGAGYPALHTAIILGQNEITQMIIKANKDSPLLLATPANDGVTAIKLALECDRVTTAAALIDLGVDLSPEKNNDFVIFNLLAEKAIFGNEANEYLAIMNNIIKNPEKNNVKLNALDGNKENALDIFQGLFTSPVSDADKKKLTPELVKFVNDLIAHDIDSQGLAQLNKYSLGNTLPYMQKEVFEKLVKSLKDTYAASPDKFAHYLNLMCGILLANDLDKMKYIMGQDLKGHIYNALLGILNISADKGLPISRDMLSLILVNTTTLNEKRKEFLKEDLLKFFPAVEVEDMLKHIKATPNNQTLSNDDRVRAQAALQEIQQKNELSNANSRIRFNDRKRAYYQFGDITRSIIKFITGLDVVRENAYYNPQSTLLTVVTNYKFGDISRSIWSLVSGSPSKITHVGEKPHDNSPSSHAKKVNK